MPKLNFGEPAPWFVAPAIGGSNSYNFNSVGGRYVVMLFHGSAARPESAAALKLVGERRSLFDDRRACFFGVTIDPDDQAQRRVAQSLPGLRHLMDVDRAVSRAFGAAMMTARGEAYRSIWMLLDHNLRVMEQRPIEEGAAILDRLADLLAHPEPVIDAPVLVVPRIFEPELCRELIDLYDRGDPRDSGYMVERGGKTVGIIDYSHKRRSDCSIEGQELRDRLRERVARSLVPMIQRVYQFRVTRIERWIVACYDGEHGGHFRPHRDNTTGGTAHRRFACTINLNAEDYEGGELRFPEFGDRTYRAPTGGAVIFSCSLLHEATRVTKGRRYAFLPFLYDDAAAAIRAANNVHLGEGVGAYQGANLPEPAAAS